MKKMRQAHLWIGLITSVFLLMEAITGLLLTEPWLLGQEQRHKPVFIQDPEQGKTLAGSNEDLSGVQQKNFEAREVLKREEGSNSLMAIVRGLHEGRLGTMDITWIIDIAAISIIFLTVSGIYLSVKLLRAQRKSRKKRTLKVSEV
jgi:hypothetical protein